MEEKRTEQELNDLTVLLTTGSDAEVQSFLKLLHPADIADLVEEVGDAERVRIFSLLPTRLGADVLPEIEEYVRDEVFEGIPDERMAEFVDEMDTDDAADILADLPRGQRRQILARIDASDSEEIRRLMDYDEETAGGLMQTELIAVLEDATVGEVIEEIRERKDEVEDVHFVFVVDRNKRLKGVLDLRDLLLADNSSPVTGIVESEVVQIRVDMDQEEVASIFMKYNMVSLPVVDDSGRLLGRIWFDDVMDVLEDEVDEDFLLMAGAGEDELEDLSVRHGVTARLPWLAITWVGGIGTSFVLAYFTKTMAQQLLPLVAFMPIVAATGGNVGNQAATIMVRGIATGRIDYKDMGRFFLGQFLVGAILGLIIGAVTAAFAHFRPTAAEFAPVIGFAMLTVMSFSALLGTMLPVAFKRVGVDPAVATAPIISSTCDIVAIAIYLSLASIAIT